MQIVSYIIATLIPILILMIIRSLDLYQTGEFRFVLLCFGWGVVAFFIALQVNPWLYYNTDLVSTTQDFSRYVAPISEEILKALILLYMVRRPKFTYFVDGAIYGFAIGIGFAVCENYEYIAAASDAGLGTAISRVLSTNLIHATASALVGVALGLARFRRTLGHVGFLLGGLALAMLLHGVFNNLVTRIGGGLVLVYSAGLGFVGVGAIAFLIFRGLADQKRWIEEKLGMADRVTAQEARVVQRLEQAHELLEPLREIYGDEKANQIERFLTKQAQLGIKRKTLDLLPDERSRRDVEKDMEKLRAEMEAARRAVGSYVMASVRIIFPPETSPVFNLLEGRLQERMAAQTVSGGAAWGAAFGGRITSNKKSPDNKD